MGHDPALGVSQVIDESITKGSEVGIAYLALSQAGTLVELERGRRDAASPAAVDAGTQFLSASITKVITAVAILRLIDRGELDLEDSLTRFVPESPYPAGVTIRRLLTHTAGIPSPMPLGWVHLASRHAEFNEHEALAAVLAQNSRLGAPPGQRYQYSNLGYWLLGRVIERLAGVAYAAFVEAEVFGPLGLDADDFCFATPKPARAARGHYQRLSPLGLTMPLLTTRDVRLSSAGRWGRFQTLLMNGPAYGGAFATVRGYGRLLRDLLGPSSRILSAGGHRSLFERHSDLAGNPLDCTLAFRTGSLGGVPYFAKAGGGPGFSGNLRIYRERGLATVFLSNRMRVSEHSIQELSDRLDRSLLEGPLRAPAPTEAPAC